MSDIVDFLEARIAEDEAAAQATVSDWEVFDASRWTDHRWMLISPATGSSVFSNAQAPSPARALAECKAKREVIAEIIAMDTTIENEWGGGGSENSIDGLKALARIWAGHPDFDPWWAR